MLFEIKWCTRNNKCSHLGEFYYSQIRTNLHKFAQKIIRKFVQIFASLCEYECVNQILSPMHSHDYIYSHHLALIRLVLLCSNIPLGSHISRISCKIKNHFVLRLCRIHDNALLLQMISRKIAIAINVKDSILGSSQICICQKS